MPAEQQGLPKISCIIPVYNGQEFLAEALNSIIAQQWDNLEIIVIDDGSTDESARVAASFPNVIVHTQPRSGVAAARNAGLERATGDFIAFLDADDIWLPGKLGNQIAQLAQTPQAGYCLTLVQHLPMEKHLLTPSLADQAENIVLFQGTDGKSVQVRLPDPTPLAGQLMSCLLARRHVFDLVGPISTATKTRADQEWFLRAKGKGIVETMVQQTLVHRRLHGKNHSLSEENSVIDDFLRIAKLTIDRRRKENTLQPIDKWTTDS